MTITVSYRLDLKVAQANAFRLGYMDSLVESYGSAYPNVHDRSIQRLAQVDLVDHLHAILVLADMCIFSLPTPKLSVDTVNLECFFRIDRMARADLEYMVYKQ